nr:hypothetical protein [Microbacterium bovistercoris]
MTLTTIPRTPTVHCANALTDLVHTARALASRADIAGATRLTRSAAIAADTLDRARTRLIEDGDEYLDAAWAFVDAGRRILAGLSARIIIRERRHAS